MASSNWYELACEKERGSWAYSAAIVIREAVQSTANMATFSSLFYGYQAPKLIPDCQKPPKKEATSVLEFEPVASSAKNGVLIQRRLQLSLCVFCVSTSPLTLSFIIMFRSYHRSKLLYAILHLMTYFVHRFMYFSLRGMYSGWQTVQNVSC